MKDANLNILLVEDNPAEARLVAEMLRESGSRAYRIRQAGCIGEALELLAGEPFNVVLLDYNLPDSNGLQGLQKISAQHPGVAVVLLTGVDDETLGFKALQHKAGDYLVKGKINADLLMRSMRYAIVRKQAEEILLRDKETLERLVKERSGELLAAQQELERARRLSDIGTLAATVAHELRNPLATIAMAASNIRRKVTATGLDGHFQNIDKKINESNQIINNLLFYSRLRAPQYEVVDMDGIIDECVSTALYAAPQKRSLLIDRALPGNMAIEADPLQMKELFSNLVSNAFDAIASRPDGAIRIRTEEGPAAVGISVEDTGPGIDSKLLDKIFEPFFSTKAKGTGLGLYVCRQIVSLHGGNISVKTNHAGTAVRVDLPRAPQNGKGTGQAVPRAGC